MFAKLVYSGLPRDIQSVNPDKFKIAGNDSWMDSHFKETFPGIGNLVGAFYQTEENLRSLHNSANCLVLHSWPAAKTTSSWESCSSAKQKLPKVKDWSLHLIRFLRNLLIGVLSYYFLATHAAMDHSKFLIGDTGHIFLYHKWPVTPHNRAFQLRLSCVKSSSRLSFIRYSSIWRTRLVYINPHMEEYKWGFSTRSRHVPSPR